MTSTGLVLKLKGLHYAGRSVKTGNLFISHKQLAVNSIARDEDNAFSVESRPSASENRCKLYSPEKQLTKAYQSLLNLEGGAQDQI